MKMTQFCLLFSPFCFIPISIWSTTKEIQNKQLRELGRSLPDVILAAKADTTKTKYQIGWNKWIQFDIQFADKDEVPPISEDFLMSLYT